MRAPLWLLLLAGCGGEGGAVGAVVGLSVPADPAAARGLGCATAGARGGSGPAAWLNAEGALPAPLPTPPFGLLLFGEGLVDRPGSSWTLRLVAGALVAGAAEVAPDAVWDLEPEDGRDNGFFAMPLGSDGWVDGRADSVLLPPLPLYGEHPVSARLLAPRLSAQLVNDQGRLAGRVILTGFLSAAAIAAETAAFLAACARGEAPGACARAPARGLEGLLLEGAGGLDARLQGADAVACQGDGCDALSVCLELGVAPTP